MTRSPKSRMTRLVNCFALLGVGALLVAGIIPGCASSVKYAPAPSGGMARIRAQQEVTRASPLTQPDFTDAPNLNLTTPGKAQPPVSTLVPPQSLPAPNEDPWTPQNPTPAQAARPA